MKTKKWLAFGLVAMLVIAITGLAIAKKVTKEGDNDQKISKESPRMERMEEGGPGDMWGRLSERLGVDRETLDKLRQIHRDAEKQGIRLRADLQIAKMELEDAVQNAKSSESEIRKAADRLGKLTAQGVDVRINALLQAKKILTTEQYEKVIRILPLLHRGEMRREMQGPMQGRPGMMMQQRGGMPGRGPMSQEFGGPEGYDQPFAENDQWNAPQGDMQPPGPMGEGRFQQRGFRPQQDFGQGEGFQQRGLRPRPEFGQGEGFGEGNNFQPNPNFRERPQEDKNQVQIAPSEEVTPSN